MSTFFTIYRSSVNTTVSESLCGDSAREELVFFFGLMYFLPAPLWIRCVYWEVASTKSGTARDEFWNEAAFVGILDHPPVILSFKLMIL